MVSTSSVADSTLVSGFVKVDKASSSLDSTASPSPSLLATSSAFSASLWLSTLDSSTPRLSRSSSSLVSSASSSASAASSNSASSTSSATSSTTSSTASSALSSTASSASATASSTTSSVTSSASASTASSSATLPSGGGKDC